MISDSNIKNNIFLNAILNILRRLYLVRVTQEEINYGDYFYIPMVTQKSYINFSGYMLEVVVRFMGFLNAR